MAKTKIIEVTPHSIPYFCYTVCWYMQNSLKIEERTALQQRQTLAPQLRLGLEFLSMDFQQIRDRINQEFRDNPAVNDIENSAGEQTISEISRRNEAEELQEDPWDQDGYEDEESAFAPDEETLERRRHFLDSHAKTAESLEEHLRAQIGFLDLDRVDEELAELLIGWLDSDGRFKGSFADLVMVTGASEERLRKILSEIMKLDPPGCGATTLEECLLAQLDSLEDSPYKNDVALVIANYLQDLAARDYSKIVKETGISEERLEDIIGIIRSLEPHPGRAYSSKTDNEVYIYPEIKAVHSSGRWIAKVDERYLPQIKISPRYLQMLKNPNLKPDEKNYIQEKIHSIEAINEALNRRGNTIQSIAQAIFDEQQEFFEKGLEGLKPMTMKAIADKVGVHQSTVSRTVRGKYVKTPKGTVELKSFFSAGIANAEGEQVAKDDVVRRILKIVQEEDKTSPLSDETIADMLKAQGFDVARRTIAKYRMNLGIESTRKRRVG